MPQVMSKRILRPNVGNSEANSGVRWKDFRCPFTPDTPHKSNIDTQNCHISEKLPFPSHGILGKNQPFVFWGVFFGNFPVGFLGWMFGPGAQELYCPSQGQSDPVADEWERQVLCLQLGFSAWVSGGMFFFLGGGRDGWMDGWRDGWISDTYLLMVQKS